MSQASGGSQVGEESDLETSDPSDVKNTKQRDRSAEVGSLLGEGERGQRKSLEHKGTIELKLEGG